jgi:hypothetical protein
MLTFIHVTALTLAASVATVLTEQFPIKSTAEIGPTYTIVYHNSQESAESEDNGPGICDGQKQVDGGCEE